MDFFDHGDPEVDAMWRRRMGMPPNGGSPAYRAFIDSIEDPPEFKPRGRAALDICNAILPPRQQNEMTKAAMLAFAGRHHFAERCRENADYAGVSDNERGQYQ